MWLRARSLTNERYECEFQKNKENGFGVGTTRDGDCYEGEWRDGDLNGFGILAFANGVRYEGKLLNGKRDGYGQLFNPDGSILEAGFWHVNQLLESDENHIPTTTK